MFVGVLYGGLRRERAVWAAQPAWQIVTSGAARRLLRQLPPSLCPMSIATRYDTDPGVMHSVGIVGRVASRLLKDPFSGRCKSIAGGCLRRRRKSIAEGCLNDGAALIDTQGMPPSWLPSEFVIATARSLPAASFPQVVLALRAAGNGGSPQTSEARRAGGISPRKVPHILRKQRPGR